MLQIIYKKIILFFVIFHFAYDISNMSVWKMDFNKTSLSVGYLPFDEGQNCYTLKPPQGLISKFSRIMYVCMQISLMVVFDAYKFNLCIAYGEISMKILFVYYI